MRTVIILSSLALAGGTAIAQSDDDSSSSSSSTPSPTYSTVPDMRAPPPAPSQPEGWTHNSSTSSSGDSARKDDSYTHQIGDTGVSAGVGATSVYTRPGIGADGPVPGNQSGSTSSTSVGPVISVPLPEGTK